MTTLKKEMKLSHVIYLLLFIFLLVAVRWSWHDQLSLPNPPTVKHGVLDLRGIELKQSSTIPMDGEWQFYPGQWIGASNKNNAAPGQLLQVPGNWNAAFDPVNNEAYGYGTYYVRILLDRPLSEPLSMWFQSIYTASEVEINGDVLAKFGVLAEEKEGHVSETKSVLITYAQTGHNELELFVRVGNYESPMKGGIVRSVQFGTQEEVNRKYLYSIGLQLSVCVILLLHAIYALIIYLMDVRKTEFIVFFLMMVASAMTIAVYHNGLLFLWIDADFAWTLKLKAFAYIWFSFFLLLMGRVLIGTKHKGVLFYSYFLLLISYTLFIAVGPKEMALYSIDKELYMILYYVPLLWAAYYFIKMILNKAVGALYLLFSVVCIINNILWGTVYYAGAAQFMFYPIDLIAAIASFSAYWFKRYFHNSNEIELLNTQLAEANKLKDRFLANTSHELRTPLHGIMNIAQSVLTRKKHILDEQSQADMELLIMVSRRMSLMLNDLLDVVRLQDKRITVHMTAVQVQSLAAGVLDMLRFLTDGTKVELRMNIKKDVPFILADEERLVQILINLVHNAIKFTEEGTVELVAEQGNGHVWIHVRDTGSGMDEAMQKRVFKRYEQGAFGQGGIGLGLSICKDLVELHGSELMVQSQPGQGSMFSFKLPMVDEKLQVSIPVCTEKELDSLAYIRTQITAAESAAMVAASYDLKEADHISIPSTGSDQIRVLAVDDDPVNLKVLIHILSTEAYYIETANSAREALDKLQHEQWDLIIADVMMPGMSGYELTRLIRERFTLFELPIILLTARAEPEDIYAGFLAGANDYVTKPVDALELKYRASSLSTLKQAVNDRLRMEAAYLQAQIHPHFLFNTLNSILALSDIDNEKMRELAEAFTSYLHISFDFLTAGHMVPLSRELELVENYLYIEQQRFEERLQVEWEVNVDMEVLIPPLTIQPLVENAVRHGILSLSQGGTLRIRIERQADAVHFMVADTGMGMDDEQLSKLLIPAGRENRGIGLFNTHSRLTRLYGKGLHIQSKPGKGTTVSFTIPDSTLH
ncbi:Sensor histidine kinase YesM [Paenibacillus sp. 1_12]|uniref:hybrid sensor histidine kinase/response regulator n=1 Tax=Paenibacillus sp. 1_12 TaxID=1566278 RepID=UPI0008E789B6|nr:ATP-binding protein [Paenibacillus sp. 1_12]SFM17796.1 Sensor histidine kinase YesM [Paenibacillus sp. 1_12]